MIKEMLADANAADARGGAGVGDHAGAAMRRLGRLFRHHRQPGARLRRRPAGRAGRHRACSPRRRRSTAPSICSPAAPRPARSARSWSTSSTGGRTTPPAISGEMNNNPSPGNKAGGLTTILEKSLGAAAKGGTTHHARRLPLCRADRHARLRLHGFARLRPGRRHRPGGLGLQPHRLHHRPRLRLRLQAVALDQAGHQQRHLRRARPRTWTSTAATSSTASPSRRRARQIFEEIIAVASGKKSKSEEFGYGDNEFVPWQIGAVM